MSARVHQIAPSTASAPRPQRGLSLIELMVAITISFLIILALIAVFVNYSRTNREMAKSSAMIENGRFAIQALQGELMHAGYWGGYVPGFDNHAISNPSGVPAAAPDPCLEYTAANWINDYKGSLIAIPLQVFYDAQPASCQTVITNRKAGTDVIVVRHADTCIAGAGNCENADNGKLYFQASFCSSDTTPYVLNEVDGEVNHPLFKKDCTIKADKRKFISSIFYVRDYASTSGDGIPTLMRTQFDLASGTLAHQSAIPLIEGIESMRIELGIDSLSKTGAPVDYTSPISWQTVDGKQTPINRGDGAADGDFVRCTTTAPSPCTNTAGELLNAVAAKIFVLARNLEQTPGYTDSKTYQLGSATLGPFNDRFKRHVYSTVVRLNNVSARRESP